MLNISDNSIKDKIETHKYVAFEMVKETRGKRSVTILSLFLVSVGIGVLFLPWTQSVSGTGYITTLNPGQRPQEINSTISGRIENWYVSEGELVEKGDTILHISEIKDAYFDPQLLGRTGDQIGAKESSVDSYGGKIKALENRIIALKQSLNLKFQQTQNKLLQAGFKVAADSMEYVVAEQNVEIARAQYERAQKLYTEGLKSLTDTESRRIKFQQAQSKTVSARNKLMASRNQLLNAKMEVGAVQNEYADKIAKAESDRFASLTSSFEAQAEVSKLQNKYSSIEVRQAMYFITAPQEGYLTKVVKNGIGETLKEGERIAMIMPSKPDYAVEIYVEPLDLPLIAKTEKVRLVFDGWPALVFSGWPGASSGTFGGQVVAMDNFISDNGKYRVLISPDTREDIPWPSALRMGSGAKGMVLLKDVSIGYEVWRQLNGFPQEFYTQAKIDLKKKKGDLPAKYDTDKKSSTK